MFSRLRKKRKVYRSAKTWDHNEVPYVFYPWDFCKYISYLATSLEFQNSSYWLSEIKKHQLWKKFLTTLNVKSYFIWCNMENVNCCTNNKVYVYATVIFSLLQLAVREPSYTWLCRNGSNTRVWSLDPPTVQM